MKSVNGRELCPVPRYRRAHASRDAVDRRRLCTLELEIEAELWSKAPDDFRARVREAYDACAHAVQDELARRGSVQATALESRAKPTRCEPPVRLLTPAQHRALRALANRLGIHLDGMLRQRFLEASLEMLSRVQASHLIDELQSRTIDETA